MAEGPLDPVHLLQRDTRDLISMHWVPRPHPCCQPAGALDGSAVLLRKSEKTGELETTFWPSLPWQGCGNMRSLPSRVLLSVLHTPGCWDSGRRAEMSHVNNQSETDKERGRARRAPLRWLGD